MTKLRMLKIIDAPLMLEWMHDKNIVENLKSDFMNKTLQDCEKFIRDSQSTSHNLHMAIVDDNDEYLGTCSLKNIDSDNGGVRSAEFGITIRKKSTSQGVSKDAMEQIIHAS